MPEQGWIPFHCGQGFDDPFDLAALPFEAQVAHHRLDELVQRHLRVENRRPAAARKGEQRIDQRAHLLRGRADDSQIFFAAGVETLAKTLLQHFYKAVDVPERRAQIVRNRIAERIEFPKRGVQLSGALAATLFGLLQQRLKLVLPGTFFLPGFLAFLQGAANCRHQLN